jgi:hypothetical protein
MQLRKIQKQLASSSADLKVMTKQFAAKKGVNEE